MSYLKYKSLRSEINNEIKTVSLKVVVNDAKLFRISNNDNSTKKNVHK